MDRKGRHGREVQALDPELGIFLVAKVVTEEDESHYGMCEVKWTLYKNMKSWIPVNNTRMPVPLRNMDMHKLMFIKNHLGLQKCKKLIAGDTVHVNASDGTVKSDIVIINDPFNRQVK